MKLNPYQIAAFTHVAREGSFSRAAQIMGVTQSSVTQHVARLEAAMGTQLFIRRRDGVELTSSAREVFEISDRMRTLEQLLAEKVSRYADLAEGNLFIVANAPRPAMPLIAGYARQYPDIRIDFRLHGWTRAMSMVRARDVDLAIISDPAPLDDALVHEVDRTAYRALLRREHPLAHGDDVSIHALVEETIILPEVGSLTDQVFSKVCARLGIGPARLIRTATFPEVKEATLHGIGTGIVLQNSLYPAAELAEIPIREMPETYRHCLVAPGDKRRLRLVESFVDFAETFQAGGVRS